MIAALKCHKYEKSVQVTGSAALFYLTNTEYRSDQSVRLRREVIQVVLNGMEQYQEVTVSLLCGLTPISDKPGSTWNSYQYQSQYRQNTYAFSYFVLNV